MMSPLSISSHPQASMDALTKVCPVCGRRYDTVAVFCQKDGARLVLADRPRDSYIGQTLLDQFEIVELIGAGGMGSVYRAHQSTLERDVAIKVLHHELTDNRDAVRRFKREAKVCTALDHPNVVKVFLFGQLPDGSLYIVMEFLRGRSLLTVAQREGALPVQRALHIAGQICDGVGEAHAAGVVHRDLKPENIFLVSKARDPDFVKVLDFGIARVLWGDDQTQATQSGLVFGTARYISPEGAAGDATDARSDVYSLGVLFYQLLSGVTPFDAPTPVQMLMMHVHDEVPHLRSHPKGQHVPGPVADVIMRALSKSADGRFDDAQAFGDALRMSAEAAGFVTGRRRATGSYVGPLPSAPDNEVPPTEMRSPPKTRPGEASVSTSTPRMKSAEATPPVESMTLAAAPSPFGDDEDAPVPAGLPGSVRPRIAKVVRLLGAALAVVMLLGGAAYGVFVWASDAFDPERARQSEIDELATRARVAFEQEAYDEPADESVLGHTARLLELDPDNREATRLRRAVTERLMAAGDALADQDDREGALAQYRRAERFSPDDNDLLDAIESVSEPLPPRPPAGVRTDPAEVIEDREITLVAVLAADQEIGSRSNPRFALRRGNRRVGGEIAATHSPDGLSFVAQHTIARPGDYTLLFLLGEGADRIELSTSVAVARDPDRRPSRDDRDPPPVTTQGGVYLPPPPPPAWTPDGPSGGAVQNPPPPPAPWTGTGG